MLLPSPAPNSGAYSSTYYQPSALERKMCETRSRQENASMSKVKKLLLEKNALGTTLDDARFMEWFEETVARAGEDLEMIDMDYFS